MLGLCIPKMKRQFIIFIVFDAIAWLRNRIFAHFGSIQRTSSAVGNLHFCRKSQAKYSILKAYFMHSMRSEHRLDFNQMPKTLNQQNQIAKLQFVSVCVCFFWLLSNFDCTWWNLVPATESNWKRIVLIAWSYAMRWPDLISHPKHTKKPATFSYLQCACAQGT